MRLPASLVGMKTPVVPIVGCANGAFGRVAGAEKAVETMRYSAHFRSSPLKHFWDKVVNEPKDIKKGDLAIASLAVMSHRLAKICKRTYQRNKELVVIGGDHSCAIGTWKGVARAVQHEGPIGLVWLDAHLDSHTPLTSRSGNLHGMPVSHLIGDGDKRLSEIYGPTPTIRPQNMALVGVRSFEEEELDFVTRNKIYVFYQSDIEKHGLANVMERALERANDGTVGFGLSIDLDAFREKDAPGTGTPEAGGIIAEDFLHKLLELDLSKLMATEIVEFNPDLDQDERTEQLIGRLLEHIYLTKWGLKCQIR
uniref:Arginase n=1 Tax=Panagrellus redivivus TaxID=6233 RepID=A0A7E4VGL6_PANRE